MTDVMSTCRATWKQLGVPATDQADMESELTADLKEAAVDGVDATTFVGGDAAGFAREWALARGLVRARWHVLGCVAVSAVVGFGALVAVNVLARPLWLHQLFDQQRAVAESWLALYGHVAFEFLLPVLVSVAVYLWVVKDTLTARTVLVVLVASPLSVWGCAEVARWLDRTGGTGRGALLFALLFGLVTGALRAAVVAVSRRIGAPADARTAPTAAA